MTLKEKVMHSLLLGLLFSFLNWMIINNLIINLSIFQYIFIELTLVVSIKLFKFTKVKLNLN